MDIWVYMPKILYQTKNMHISAVRRTRTGLYYWPKLEEYIWSASYSTIHPGLRGACNFIGYPRRSMPFNSRVAPLNIEPVLTYYRPSSHICSAHKANNVYPPGAPSGGFYSWGVWSHDRYSLTMAITVLASDLILTVCVLTWSNATDLVGC